MDQRGSAEAGRKGGTASHRRRSEIVGGDQSQSGDVSNSGSSEAAPSVDERSGSDDGEQIR